MHCKPLLLLAGRLDQLCLIRFFFSFVPSIAMIMFFAKPFGVMPFRASLILACPDDRRSASAHSVPSWKTGCPYDRCESLQRHTALFFKLRNSVGQSPIQNLNIWTQKWWLFGRIDVYLFSCYDRRIVCYCATRHISSKLSHAITQIP